MSDEKGVILEVDFKPVPPGEAELEPLLRIKRRGVLAACDHAAIEVDEHLRRVLCKGCGETLDPVQAILDIARHWSHYAANLDIMKRELSRRRERIEELKREEANLRARVKRLRGNNDSRLSGEEKG